MISFSRKQRKRLQSSDAFVGKSHSLPRPSLIDIQTLEMLSKALFKRAISVPMIGKGQGSILLQETGKKQSASHSARFKKSCKITMAHILVMALLSNFACVGTEGDYPVNVIKK